jgi:iron complex outermembrane receptor protein
LNQVLKMRSIASCFWGRFELVSSSGMKIIETEKPIMKAQILHRPRPRSLATAIAAVTLAQAIPGLTQPILEEVIVTAQKRTQSVQDIPLTVTAISESVLQDAGISNVADMTKLVPQLNIYRVASPAQASITIRGAGTGVADPTLEPSVGVYVDNVFMPRSIFGLSDLVDVDRIEVLMGPQGTLYGKNTNAGVIAVYTKGAPEELEGMVEITAGEDSLFEGKFSLGGTITDTVGYRLAGIKRERDGLVENLQNGNDELDELDSQAFRGQLFWDATDALSFRLIGYASNREGSMGDPTRVMDPTSAMVTGFGPFPPVTNVSGPKDRKATVNQPNDGKLETSGGSLQFDYEMSNGLTLTSITGYQEWEQSDVVADTDGTWNDSLTVNDRMEEDSYSQELRLTSPGGETLDWLVGGFWFKSDLDRGSDNRNEVYSWYGFDPFMNNAPVDLGIPGVAPMTITADGDDVLWANEYETESIAVFAQATWNISDRTSITAGLRYGEEEKDFNMHVSVYDRNNTLLTGGSLLGLPGYTPWEGGLIPTLASGGLNQALGGAAMGDFDQGTVERKSDLDEDDVTGMLSLNHFIGDAMLYATVSTGSKSGGFNGSFGPASAENREFDTEDTINYEVGAKIDGLLGGRARLNIAAFYTKYEDFQAVSFDPATVSFIVLNAGEQVTQGIDLAASFAVTENLTLDGKISYLDAEYEDFEGANCNPTSGLPATCDLSGETMEYAPDWAGAVSANYIKPFDGGSEVYARLALDFKTDHLVDPTRAAYAEDQNYELWDGRIGWRNDNWDLSVWGKNLTDEEYFLYTGGGLVNNQYAALDGGASFRNFNTWLNEPRTFGMTLRYNL